MLRHQPDGGQPGGQARFSTTKLALLLTNGGDPLLDEEAVAGLLGITPRTLANQRSAGTCPIVMAKVGSLWKAHIDDVAAYIDGKFDAARRFTGSHPRF